MSGNGIFDGMPPPSDGDLTVTIRISPERARELYRLAEKEKSSLDDLAKQFLETEIEAQYGLIYGPWSRRHMYRV
jgi:predicted HicB family RNase H-like nuclease